MVADAPGTTVGNPMALRVTPSGTGLLFVTATVTGLGILSTMAEKLVRHGESGVWRASPMAVHVTWWIRLS
jgi:hypothetical protein